MQIARGTLLCALGFCLASFACEPQGHESQARDRLTRVLRDSLGATTDPNVAFIKDGGSRDSHLYVMFDTTAFPNVSDSVFELHARDLARFAIRHYDQAEMLDSVTVESREAVKPGMWRIHHTRAFAIAELKGASVR